MSTLKKCKICHKQKDISNFDKFKNGTIKQSCCNCCIKNIEKINKYNCIHGTYLRNCKTCGYGMSYCIHGKYKYSCKQCGGQSICQHGVLKVQCKVCNNIGYLSNIIRNCCKRVKHPNNVDYIKLLGCSINEFVQHIENQFTDDMTWENYGTYWEIDHVIPLNYGKPEPAEALKRLHYMNTQPMLKTTNRSKRSNILPDEIDKTNLISEFLSNL